MEKEQLSESQIKTAKSCYNMFVRWQTKKSEEIKGNTPAHYIKDCINGYPNNSKMKPSLLKARLKGIVRYAKFDEELTPIDEKAIIKGEELIAKYKDQISKQKENGTN